MPTTVFVNLDYNEHTNSLPFDKWEKIEIYGLNDQQNPEYEAIGFALEMSGLDHSLWPAVAYTSLSGPLAGSLCTRHSISISELRNQLLGSSA